jgi:hypothetical protein
MTLYLMLFWLRVTTFNLALASDHNDYYYCPGTREVKAVSTTTTMIDLTTADQANPPPTQIS